MAPHRTRQETAAALRRAPAPAPVDDAFIAVLANLAASSTAPTPARTLQTRIGLRVAAAVSAVAMVTAGSAYAAYQIGQDPAPTPVPAHETDAPDRGANDSTSMPARSNTAARDHAPREGDEARGEHTTRHGGEDGDARQTHEETRGSAGSGPESHGPNVVIVPGHDDEGDENQGSTQPEDQGDDADDQGDGTDTQGDQDEQGDPDDQGDNADDENDAAQDGDSDAADDDQGQQTQRPGDDDPDQGDGEVTGEDDNS